MGLLDDEELLRRPAFGVFPQMQPRRRFQDPVGAANVPLDVTRGRLAGLLGLLPDALNFMGRSPMPTEMFGETQYEPAQQLPYGSEYYLQNLPLKPTSRIGEVAGQAGAFVPLNPMPAAKAVAAGAKALGPTAVGMGERYLQRQGLMPAVVPNFPTSITNRSEVKNVANNFADQFKQMGFDVTLDHSGSKAGASSYLRVSDPKTGRFLSKPIRISDHSKGAKELDANINVLNPQEDFTKITSALNDMREKGDTLVFKQDKYAQELIANGIKPKTAYQRAKTEITENQPSPYPQQAAIDLAQQRAALPIEQGGLGLPVGNTAEQRAAAMGFDTDAYHGTTNDFNKFAGRLPTYAAEEPRIADIYANATGRHMALSNINAGPNIIPLKLGGKEFTVSDLGEGGGGWFSDNLAQALGIPRTRTLINELPKYGIDRLKVTDMDDIGGVQTQHMIPSGSDNIRSRFAAFDPFRRTSAIAATMGVAAPDLMAGQDNEMPEAVRQYIADPALGLLQDEEERKKLGGLLFR